MLWPYLPSTRTRCSYFSAYSSRSWVLAPMDIACLSPLPVPRVRCAGNGVGDVTPGAARLISETAQRVHTIGQKQKNDQHLRRVQALLSGRQAKGLTSGSLCTCPSALIFPFLTHPTSSVLPAHTPCLLSLPFLLLPWSMVLELHQSNSSPIPQVAGSYARAGC